MSTSRTGIGCGYKQGVGGWGWRSRYRGQGRAERGRREHTRRSQHWPDRENNETTKDNSFLQPWLSLVCSVDPTASTWITEGQTTQLGVWTSQLEPLKELRFPPFSSSHTPALSYLQKFSTDAPTRRCAQKSWGEDSFYSQSSLQPNAMKMKDGGEPKEEQSFFPFCHHQRDWRGRCPVLQRFWVCSVSTHVSRCSRCSMSLLRWQPSSLDEQGE